MEVNKNKDHNIFNKKVILSFLLFIVSIFLGVLIFFKGFFVQQYNQSELSQFHQSISELKEKLSKYQNQDNLAFLLETDKKIYNSYEPIYIFFGALDHQNNIISNLSIDVKIINDQNQEMQNIFDKKTMTLIFSETNQIYYAVWYLKDTRYRGILEAQISIKSPNISAHKNTSIAFSIKQEENFFHLPNTFTFLGLDAKEEVLPRRILSVDGKESTHSALKDWMTLFNNDAIILPAAITKTFDFESQKIALWDTSKLKESKNIAQQFVNENKKSALWIQALEIDGSFQEELGYVESQRTNIQYTNASWISITDQKRGEDLKKIFKELISDPSVSFVGFSKALSYNNFHNELLAIFTNQFSFSETNNSASFEKWKEYILVEYFKKITKENDKNKPIFFIFEGKELLESPNMLEMAFAIGADFVMIDFEASLEYLETQLNNIKKNTVFELFKDRIVLSYEINYNNVLSGDASSLENWVNENLRLLKDNNIHSLKIQDFYRALFGNRGSYPAYEWLLMIGDLIAKWKEQNFIFPIIHDITPNKRNIAETLEFNIEIKNVSSKMISDYTLKMLPVTANISNYQNFMIRIPEIKPKEIIRTNVVISNIMFKTSVLQKKTRFIGFLSKYQMIKKNISEVHMVSFIDPDVEKDQSLGMDNDFNRQMKILREEEKQLEKLRLEALSNQIKEQERLRKLSTQKTEVKTENAVVTEETNKNSSEDTKKVPWWKRNAKDNKGKEKD